MIMFSCGVFPIFEISFFMSFRNIVFGALSAWVAPSCASSRHQPVLKRRSTRCAYIDLGEGLYGEPSV
jgi:hypothetical protein